MGYWGRLWAYMDASSGHREVGVSSTLATPSSRVTVAVLVDCPHEPQFLPDMTVAQSAPVAAEKATRQVRPFTQKGEAQDNMKLEVTAKWLFPRGYVDTYSAAVLDQLKAWETFRMLNIGRSENPSMPNGDVTPHECPRAQCHGQAHEDFSGRPIVNTRAPETTCWSQVSSTQTTAADQKLQQNLVVNLPRMGKEEVKSISSMGSTQQPRTSTPVEVARARSAETEPMEVDVAAEHATSQSSSAGVVTRPKTQGGSLRKHEPN